MSSGCTIDFVCEHCGEPVALTKDPRGSSITMLVESCDCRSRKERDEQKNRAIKAEAKLLEMQDKIYKVSAMANALEADLSLGFELDSGEEVSIEGLMVLVTGIQDETSDE